MQQNSTPWPNDQAQGSNSAAPHAGHHLEAAEQDWAQANSQQRTALADQWQSAVFLKAQEWQELHRLEKLQTQTQEVHEQALQRLGAAYAKGYAQGQKAGFAHATAQVLDRLHDEQALAARMVPRLQTLVEAALRHLLAIEEGAALPLTGRVLHALQRAKYPAYAKVRVHPGRVEELHQWQTTVQEQLGPDHPGLRAVRQLEVVPDEALSTLDLELSFDSGVIESVMQMQVDSLADWFSLALQKELSQENKKPQGL